MTNTSVDSFSEEEALTRPKSLKKFKLKKFSSDSTLDAWLFAEDEEIKRLNKQNSATIKNTRYTDVTRL